MYRFVFVLSIVILSMPLEYLMPDSNINVDEILQKSEAIYRNCKSYSDEGYVKTTFMNKEGQKAFITKIVFKTAYIRPYNFRFEYSEEQAGELIRPYIIWTDGKTIKSYWELTGESNPSSLSMAIAGATGVSNGAALNISSLLIPEVKRCQLLTRIENPVLLSEKKDDNGIACYRIQKDKNETIWIQKESFLI